VAIITVIPVFIPFKLFKKIIPKCVWLVLQDKLEMNGSCQPHFLAILMFPIFTDPKNYQSMKHVSFFVFALISCSFFVVQAQTAPGYYINAKGDSIAGSISIPLKADMIQLHKMTFDFQIAVAGQKAKKVDRLVAKGFGFVYAGKTYTFETWDVTANKQLYLISPMGAVAPDGVYFILKTEEGALPTYSLFQQVEDSKKMLNDPGTTPGYMPAYRTEFNGYKVKRDIIIKHPSKGFIYLADKYPPLMKLPEMIQYLELEPAFTVTLTKKENDLLEVVNKYNSWKAATK
jgi:hypothetical protein